MLKKIIFSFCFVFFYAALQALPPEIENSSTDQPLLQVDNTALINTNLITMFVTNHGNIGRDLSGYFGYDFGTWYPVFDTLDIRNNINGTANKSPLYCAGIWIGGIVDGTPRVSISEYASEFVPGPMLGGTYQNDQPAFRNYKLYSDSLFDNPNNDYLNWPADQGAPVDLNAHPIIQGDQMLWSVYNDADPNQHDVMQSSPLGIEVQQTVFGFEGYFLDTSTVPAQFLPVTQNGNSNATVTAILVDPNDFTGHSYRVEFADTVGIAIDTIIPDPINFPEVYIIDTLNLAWHLFDLTEQTYKLMWQTNFSGDENSPVVDGYMIRVRFQNSSFNSFLAFECVANANGPIDPPEAAAAHWRDFPVPTEVDPDGYPTEGQQAGNGIWLFHTADNGGTNDGGTRASYSAFLERVLRNDNAEDIGKNDYEMRFSSEGSYAVGAFESSPEPIYHVPFELWQIGVGTPNDPSDDVRLTPWMIDADGNGEYNLQGWGDSNNGAGDLEHSVSGSNDDPQTDWIYWILPADDSPGQTGYLADVATFDLNNMNTGSYGFDGEEIMARTVLVNWNGGSFPPFNQDIPEEGTVFRIRTAKESLTDTFEFTQTLQTSVTTNPEGSSLYIKYKLYNKGTNNISDMYLSIWSDPDIGNCQ